MVSTGKSKGKGEGEGTAPEEMTRQSEGERITTQQPQHHDKDRIASFRF